MPSKFHKINVYMSASFSEHAGELHVNFIDRRRKGQKPIHSPKRPQQPKKERWREVHEEHKKSYMRAEAWNFPFERMSCKKIFIALLCSASVNASNEN